ncbi:MAG: extracellular solute-binding protein, partial [Lachnospiraceae bacterium]|nr:extracellular solute-binding protein [Lachnospiraceae bacterium]
MKSKRLLSLLLTGAMVLGLAACGSDSTGSSTSTTNKSDSSSAATTEAGTDSASGDKLVIWTLAADLEQFAARYQETTGVETKVVVIAPADYPTKVQTALVGGEKEPDIIVGEPQMLGDMYDAGFFANLDDFGAKDYEGQIVDYVWEVGQDADGIQRAISYQITPAGIYYRRDIAKTVFGTDDPVEI